MRAGLGAGLDVPGGPLTVTTIGRAVSDLRAAMCEYWTTLGWGPWRIYRQEPPGLTEMRYRGRAASFSFLVAGATVPGSPAFWLCQPLDGPSLYRDLAEEGAPGPHFATIWRRTEADSMALKAWLIERGAVDLMSARVHGSIEFSFLDARTSVGMILEVGSGLSANQPLAGTYP
jgi:hypothetical protein